MALNSLTVIATFSFFRSFFFDVSIFYLLPCVAVALINEIVLINFTSHVAETTSRERQWDSERGKGNALTNISEFDLNLLSISAKEASTQLYLSL